MRERGNIREGARERSRGSERTFARWRGNVREGRGNVRERRPSGPPYVSLASVSSINGRLKSGWASIGVDTSLLLNS